LIDPISEKAGDSASVSKHKFDGGLFGAQFATSSTRTFSVPGMLGERIEPTE
jgi:hypothetical protein